jgi:acyl-CoA synthetase (NDP forming)
MSLSNIFEPQSIAVIGASAQEGSVGNFIFKNLLNGYEGQVFPINPKNTEILNVKCFASVLDLSIIPDLAIIVVPSKVVPMVLQQVADKGVKGVVIISAGFKEVGGEGIELENKVKEICERNGISLIGPNCLGVINPWINMNGSFANSVPPKGNIAFLSQSGAICTAIIDYAKKLDLGFSKFVSVGNKALSSEVEMLRYLESDPQTEVIALYSESLSDASEIIETMKTITKPVVILKSGRTAAGGGASSSHTGALASEDILYETLFRQARIIRANGIEELFDFMQVLSRYPDYSEKLKAKSEKSVVGKLPLDKGLAAQADWGYKGDKTNNGDTEAASTKSSITSNAGVGSFACRGEAPFGKPEPTSHLLKMTNLLGANQNLQVAIITNAGGPGVLTTDSVIQNGMELAKISDESLVKLKLVLPLTANFHNPFDLIGDAPAQRYQDALEILTQDGNVDAMIVILTPQTTTEIDQTADIVSNFAKASAKPIIASFIGGDKVMSGVDILRKNKVVHIDFPENAARALSVLNKNVAATTVSPLSSGDLAVDKKNPLVRGGSEADGVDFSMDSLLWRHGGRRYTDDAKQKAQVIFDEYKAINQNYIPEVDAKKIFELYNIPTVKSVYCQSVEEVEVTVQQTFGTLSNAGIGSFAALKMTDALEDKFILKIISADVMHKSDVGGIIANVSIENAAREFKNMMKAVQSKLPNAKLEGVLFSQMVDLSSGVEFILGAKKDLSLGTAIMFGLGGTMVELIHDVVFGFGKLERSDIMEMIDQLKSKKIINGYRGKSPLDLEAIITTVKGLSNMLADFPNITEVDMNPVLVGYNNTGVKVLDAKIVFE